MITYDAEPVPASELALHEFNRDGLVELLARLTKDPFGGEKVSQQRRVVATLIERYEELDKYQIWAALQKVEIEIPTVNGRAHPSNRSTKGKTERPPTRLGFPMHVFPKWIQTYCAQVAAACEVPQGVVGFVLLGMLGAAYGTHLQLVFKHGYVRYCHDFFFLIADVSVGKSPVFAYLSRPLYEIQRELRELTEPVEPSDKDKPLPKPQVIISDATPEAMVRVQSENGGAVSMVSPDTPLLAQLCANGRNPWPLVPYLSSHTGEPYHVHRITRGENEVEKARLAIVSATQPGTLKRVHERPELDSSGFIARCTFYVVPPLTREDLHPGDPEVSEELQRRYESTLAELGIRYRSNDKSPLRFTRDAAAARVNWIDRMRPHYKLPGGDLHHLAGHCAKLEEKVSRWAALLHVLWAKNDRKEPGELTIEDFQRGFAIYDFAFENYNIARDLMAEGPADALTNELRKLCQRYQGKTVTYRMLRKNCSAFKGADERMQEQAIRELEDEGLVAKVENSNPGGRPSPALKVL